MRKIAHVRPKFGSPMRTCTTARKARLWNLVDRMKSRQWTVPIDLVIQIDITMDLIRQLALLKGANNSMEHKRRRQ